MDTLGTRIAALRRQEGLSQEELGERLGVSRQAISKWESDAAIPEVEKLVALSRLFRIPVGVLLGVEAAAPDGGEALSGEQLDAVERIVSRYLEELEKRQPAPARKRRWPRVLAAAAVVVFALYLLGRTVDLQNQLSNLSSSMTFMEHNLSYQINGISGSVQSILEEQNSLIEDSSVGFSGFDLTNATFDLSVSVTLKEYSEGETVALVAAPPSGKPVQEPMLRQAGSTTFTHQMTVPLTDEVQVSILISSGSTFQTARLETLGGLRDGTELSAYGGFNGSYQLSGSTARFNGSVDYSIDPAYYMEDLHPISLSAQLYRSGQLVETVPAQEVEEGWTPNTYPGIYGAIPFDVSCPAQPGDVFALVLCWEDSAGRTRFSCLEHLVVNSAGTGWESNDSMEAYEAGHYDPVNDRSWDILPDAAH